MVKILVYISIITSMIGSASIFALDLGLVQLSLFRVSILLLFLYMAINIIIINKKIKLNNHKANSYSIKFMFIWIIYAFFSLAWIKDYNAWIKSIFFLSIGLMGFLVYSKYLKSKFDVLLAFRLILIMAVIHNLIGWYEVFTGNYMFLSINSIAQYTRLSFPVSTFGNTNDFATFMLFCFWITYICLINTKNFIFKTIHIFLMISSVFLLITTTSRANLLGFILSIIVFIVLCIRNKKNRNVLFVLFCLSFLIVLLNPEIIKNIFISINKSLNFDFSSLDGSDHVRINLIKNGLFFLISTLGFGVGAGNIEHWMSYEAIYNTGGVLNIHNWWLEILVNYGLIIFIMYLTFYVKLFKSVYRKFKHSRSKIDISISLGTMCFIGGYIIGSISSSSNINSEWLWVFWGIVVAYQGIIDL